MSVMENKMKGMIFWARASIVLLVAGLAVSGCDRTTKYDTNLLKNGSFEDIGSDGIPKGWKLVLFKGAPDQPEVVYGIDTLTVDGEHSFYFRGDPGTRRWYFLQQEVKVSDIKNVRLRGWMLGDGLQMRPYQNAMCNFLLTFYDKNHHRFQLERAADRRTPLRPGTYPWEEQVYTFPVPEGTHYVAVSCLLGMTGQVWFDNVSLEIPTPTPWETKATKNYVFHWLPGHPMPPDAPEQQQRIFDAVAYELGVKSDAVINYYFYPDTTTIQKMLGIKGYMYVSWDDYDFHTLSPSDNHEVVHFITDSIGRPPRSIAEGTVVWLHSQAGDPWLDNTLRKLYQENRIAPLTNVFEHTNFMKADPTATGPTAAGFVKFLVDAYGKEHLMELYSAINGMNSYAPIATGFQSVYGIPLPQAEQAFHMWLKKNYGS